MSSAGVLSFKDPFHLVGTELYATVMLGDFITQAKIDTGAPRSMCNDSITSEMATNHIKVPSVAVIQLSDGSIRTTKEMLIVDIQLGEHRSRISLLILPTAPENITLGMDFLLGLGLTMGFGCHTLKLRPNLSANTNSNGSLAFSTSSEERLSLTNHSAGVLEHQSLSSLMPSNTTQQELTEPDYLLHNASKGIDAINIAIAETTTKQSEMPSELENKWMIHGQIAKNESKNWSSIVFKKWEPVGVNEHIPELETLIKVVQHNKWPLKRMRFKRNLHGVWYMIHIAANGEVSRYRESRISTVRLRES